MVCDSCFNVPTPQGSWIPIAFMRALSPLSVFKLWCTLHSTHLSTPRTAFSASLTVSRSDDRASWANATIIAAPLFGLSVSGWTRSSPKSRIFRCRRDTESITASLDATSTETYTQYELFCSSFNAGPGLGIRCNKEVFAIWKPRPSRFAVVRGRRRAHCRNDDVRF